MEIPADRAGPPVLNLPESYNVSTLIDANLQAGRANKVAIYCGEEQITYGDLHSHICRMGRGLQSLGVAREQRVLLILNDTPAFPVSFFGAIRIGAVPVPVNPLLKEEDYRHFIEDSGAAVVVTEAKYTEKVRRALQGYPEQVTIVASGEPAAGSLSFKELLSAHPDNLIPAKTHRDDVAFWLYSGGSTGWPKAVIHLQHDIPWTCETYGRHVLGIKETDLAFAAVLFHAYGLGNGLTLPFWAGASTVLYPGKPTPQGLLETIERFRPTLFSSVPTLYNSILNDPAARRFDLSSLRLCISAAEPLPAEILQRWHEMFGLTILDGIGSTEMLHIFCSNKIGAVRPGSSGKPVPGYDLRLVDDKGHPAAPGHAGNLQVRGESAAPAYWRQHAKTKETMRGDWVATGDRYRIDDDGYYWYEGRTDDMIKVGGEWVSPIEIEGVLLEHSAVQEVAVVGIKVDGLMRVRAVVVPAPNHRGTEDLSRELQEWCKCRLQRYKYPHRIDYVSGLPKTATGKVQRYKLRESSGPF